MTLRCSFAALAVPLIFAACGDSKGAPSGAGGASPIGVIEATGGSVTDGGSSDAPAASGGAAAGRTGMGGVSAVNFGGTSPIASGGQSGSLASGGSGAGSAGLGSGGAPSGGAMSVAGSAGMMVGGIPGNWIPVTGVDASKVPGPNFETVQYMFKGLPCSGSNCHFGGRNHLQVDKTPDQLYTYMKSFKTLECGKLIDTENPSQSALVKYLRGPCGSIERMPSYKCFDDGDELCVPEYYIQAIEQWIAAGAPR